MKEIDLKTYDIASYDIELDFIKQIAPIEKAIEKLNSSHESKSLKAHKDFLVKDKKSKDAINQLQDKAVVKEQRIERAVENKLKKLQSKETRYKTDLEEAIAEKNAEADLKKAEINDVIEQLKAEESEQIEEIKQKYKTNIESYVEKLDIYNNNFDNNKKRHIEQINQYQEQLNKYIEDIQSFYNSIITELDSRLSEFLSQKEESNKTIQANFDSTSRKLGNIATTIRKDANIHINEVENYVFDLKAQYKNHYEPLIQQLDDQIQSIKTRFNERVVLIEKDLEINLTKQEQQLEEIKDSKNKKAKRSILMKIDLFNIRAATTIKYEGQLVQEEIVVLQKEKEIFEKELEFELNNLEKLHAILQNDENNLKETGDYFKNLNISLKEQLNNFEYSNNEYLYKHEQLKSDFIKQYTNIFKDLKQSTVELAQTYLEKIADNNHEIDEINKFLDTAEPLKEIEVNRLRENIEINEVQERYKIKYSKQQYEIDTINNTLEHDIKILEIDTKELLSEYQKEVVDIKNKEVFDKALEKAKLKHSKAQQVYNLRLNNTKLERKLLDNKYETEMAIYDQQKKLADIDVRKHNALRSKEIEYTIKNTEIEANYKIEVIHKALEEQLLKLEEESSKATYEKDAYTANLNIEIDAKKADIKKQKQLLEREALKKTNLIDEALERELREPTKNKLKTEAIIDERLSKLDVNNAIFADFINDSLESYKDDKLSLEQIREVILNNEMIIEKANRYIDRSYEVFQDALTFMSDIEKRSILNKIAASSDQGNIKKWNKQVQKIEFDQEKNTSVLKQTQGDHKVVISNLIKAEIESIKQSNPDTIEQLIQIVDTAYNKIFNKLNNIQEDLKKDTTAFYEPLLRNDQELIDYANKNAEKAKLLVTEDTAKLFAPLDEELSQFTSNKEEQRQTFNQKIDETIKELRSQINHLKNDALEKVHEINQEKDKIINEKILQKQKIEETEEQEIVKRYELIDQQVSELTKTYQEALKHLEEKDNEAKKIFDYEDRIHNIAVESATARFNDSNIKAQNVHMNNVKQYQTNREQAKQHRDTTEHNNNQALLKLTKRFEKNIFTVRPRLEESIGDAQKEIDNQIAEKTVQLQDLKDNNQKITTSAENSLYTAFLEGADRLRDNLQNYIDKYRVIETEYHTQNDTINTVISNNNATFSNALFELSKTKHSKIINELHEINSMMFRKEE